jgi:cytochrome oxidase assembly protein ShyY1
MKLNSLVLLMLAAMSVVGTWYLKHLVHETDLIQSLGVDLFAEWTHFTSYLAEKFIYPLSTNN